MLSGRESNWYKLAIVRISPTYNVIKDITRTHLISRFIFYIHAVYGPSIAAHLATASYSSSLASGVTVLLTFIIINNNPNN